MRVSIDLAACIVFAWLSFDIKLFTVFSADNSVLLH